MKSCNDFKYFLPRLLQIVYENEEQDGYFFEVIWVAIAKANYTLWPQQEQEVINDFAKGYLEKVKRAGDEIKIGIAFADLREAGIEVMDKI